MNLDEDISKFLNKLGLSYSEIRIYLQLLKKPCSRIIDISQATRLPRSTVKYNIDKLKKLGFINTTIKNKTRLYSTSNPQMLKGQVLEGLQRYRELEATMDISLDKILSVYKGNSHAQSTARILESKKQIDGALNGAFLGNDLVIFGNVDQFIDNYKTVNKRLALEYINEDKKVIFYCNKEQVGKLKKFYSNLTDKELNINLIDGIESTLYFYDERVLCLSYDPYLTGIFVNQPDLYNLLIKLMKVK